MGKIRLKKPARHYIVDQPTVTTL